MITRVTVIIIDTVITIETVSQTVHLRIAAVYEIESNTRLRAKNTRLQDKMKDNIRRFKSEQIRTQSVQSDVHNQENTLHRLASSALATQ